ncbi:MAG: isoleucine--tRNA ligase [archaeon]
MERYDVKTVEEQVLDFWNKNKIYPKAKAQNKKGKKFYFLQGPPYTSGQIHIGQAWNNSLKDFALRYKRMRGFDVWDRAGYDMHGLPTANKVQQANKLKFKEDIVKFGLKKFIQECIDFSSKNAKIMDKDLWRMGVWMDYENAYWPIKNEFIESEWFLIKQADKNKRLYKDKKVMTWCASCETALAKHELDYKTVEDNSIFLKFKLKGKKDEYLVIWTTTPWTIPYNLAVMAGPEIDYVRAKVGDEVWIVAKALVGVFMGGVINKKFKILEDMKGEKLKGLKYEHPFSKEIDYSSIKSPHLHSVILSKEYVDTTAGSGLVHCAPGCGPEDYEVGRAHDLPPFNELDGKGAFSDKMGKFAGLTAKKDDKKFVEELKKNGSLLAETPVEHEYAHCWRCHEPVVFEATDQWFFKIEDLKEKMRKNNQKTYWWPKGGQKSFDNWVENLKDNSITRQRFWGSPVPIWECECGEYHVFGSRKELEKAAINKIPENLHRPWIDEVKIKCKKCGKEVKRTEDILDVWIDAGTASWNCLEFPHRLDYFKKYFPADLILEATEQVRLWFSMLLVASELALQQHCYKAVYMHGMILDYEGIKMSKSQGNIISPNEVIDKYGADTLRFYMCSNRAGENMNFSWDEAKLKHRNLAILWNVCNYLIDYCQTNKIKPKLINTAKGKEEKYILSKMNSCIKRCTELFDKYRLDEPPGHVEELFLELSRTYIKMIRDKASMGADKEKQEVANTIYTVLLQTLKMFAPICPFVSEKLYQNLKIVSQLEESVHLEKWPKTDEKIIDLKLETNMELAKEVTASILSARDKSQLGVRWPSQEVIVEVKEDKDVKKPKNIQIMLKELLPIIQTQTNVKSIVFGKGKSGKASEDYEKAEFSKGSIYLNTKLTPSLEVEGFAREFTRRFQNLRKTKGLKKEDLADFKIEIPDFGFVGEVIEELNSNDLWFSITHNLKDVQDLITPVDTLFAAFKMDLSPTLDIIKEMQKNLGTFDEIQKNVQQMSWILDSLENQFRTSVDEADKLKKIVGVNEFKILKKLQDVSKDIYHVKVKDVDIDLSINKI